MIRLFFVYAVLPAFEFRLSFFSLICPLLTVHTLYSLISGPLFFSRLMSSEISLCVSSTQWCFSLHFWKSSLKKCQKNKKKKIFQKALFWDDLEFERFANAFLRVIRFLDSVIASDLFYILSCLTWPILNQN